MFHLSIKAKLSIGLCLILVIAFAAINLLSYNVSRTVLMQSLKEDVLPGISNDIYQEIQRDLIIPVQASSLMANDTFLKDWVLNGEQDLSKITKYLWEIKNEYGFFSSFLISDNTKRYYHFNGLHKLISPKDEHDVWYYRFIASGKKYDLDVDVDEVSQGALTIFINHRLSDYQGNLLGVTGVGLKMSDVGRMLSSYQKRYDKHIYLVDRQGVVQVHAEQDLIESMNIYEQPGMNGVARKLLSETATEPVIIEYDPPGREHSIIISRFIPEFEWFLIVEHAEGQAMREIRTTLYRNLLIGLMVTVLVIVINVLLVNYYQGKLEDLATTDDLTGLPNRRFFMAQAAREVANASRAGRPVSMLMIDLDHFKSVNDTCGHATGDCVLRQVAQLLQQALRKGDLAGRIGGEEFAVILPQAGAASAQEVAERLRVLVEQSSLPSGEDTRKVTASVGVTTDTEGRLELESLLKQADRALYAAKERGRNMVVVMQADGPQA